MPRRSAFSSNCRHSTSGSSSRATTSRRRSRSSWSAMARRDVNSCRCAGASFPAWAKDPTMLPLMINARAEGLPESPAYRWAFKYRRCLVPASGFYEWRDARRADRSSPSSPAARRAERCNQLFAFAGLWETWLGADGSEIDTAAIVTTEASEFLRPLHERMPVVLAPEDHELWLSADTTLKEAQALAQARAGGLLCAHARIDARQLRRQRRSRPDRASRGAAINCGIANRRGDRTAPALLRAVTHPTWRRVINILINRDQLG